MKQYNIHFLSNIPCSIFINGNNVGVIDNIKTFFIDIISYSTSLIVSADPINQKKIFISNTFRISKFDKNLISSSTLTKIIPFPEDNYDVILNFDTNYKPQQLLTVFNQNINGYSVMVTNSSNSTITIFKNTDCVFSDNIDIISDIMCENKNNFIVLSAFQNNGEYLLIFDTIENKIVFNDNFLKVEKSETEIKALKPLNDFFKHGVVSTLNFESKQTSYYTVFIENKNVNISNNLVPYAFLECVKASDYSKAKSYLDISLGNITNAKLDSYFSKIENIYFNCYFFEPNQTNYTIETNNGLKNYTFTMLNNKICEIEENSI